MRKLVSEMEEANIQEDQPIPDFDGSIDLFNQNHVNRSCFEDKKGTQGDEITKMRVLPYIPSDFKRRTEFFSNFSADELFQTIIVFAAEYSSDTEANTNEYKVTLKIINEENYVEVVIKILRVNKEKHCVEITKKKGDKYEFLNVYMKIKAYFGGMVNVGL